MEIYRTSNIKKKRYLRFLKEWPAALVGGGVKRDTFPKRVPNSRSQDALQNGATSFDNCVVCVISIFSVKKCKMWIYATCTNTVAHASPSLKSPPKLLYSNIAPPRPLTCQFLPRAGPTDIDMSILSNSSSHGECLVCEIASWNFQVYVYFNSP